MKYFNKVFDIFLYEGIFIFLFSLLLLLLNDQNTKLFFSISITSVIIAILLGIIAVDTLDRRKRRIDEPAHAAHHEPCRHGFAAARGERPKAVLLVEARRHDLRAEPQMRAQAPLLDQPQ